MRWDGSGFGTDPFRGGFTDACGVRSYTSMAEVVEDALNAAAPCADVTDCVMDPIITLPVSPTVVTVPVANMPSYAPVPCGGGRGGEHINHTHNSHTHTNTTVTRTETTYTHAHMHSNTTNNHILSRK